MRYVLKAAPYVLGTFVVCWLYVVYGVPLWAALCAVFVANLAGRIAEITRDAPTRRPATPTYGRPLPKPRNS